MKDVIVIGERMMERGWKGERAYIGHAGTVLLGTRRIVLCTNMNIDIMKSHVTHAQRRSDSDTVLSRNRAAWRP